MVIETGQAARNRINQQIEQLKNEFGSGVIVLLKEANKTHLKNQGKVAVSPTIDRNSVRWALKWTEDEVTTELNVVVVISDDGNQARVDRVWVHRHVTTPFDYDGHTPTTHMHRLTGLALAEIRAAIEAEFK